MNDIAVRHLEIRLHGLPKIAILKQLENEELNWVAARLRTDLR